MDVERLANFMKALSCFMEWYKMSKIKASAVLRFGQLGWVHRRCAWRHQPRRARAISQCIASIATRLSRPGHCDATIKMWRQERFDTRQESWTCLGVPFMGDI
jgi:hypothetical protein